MRFNLFVFIIIFLVPMAQPVIASDNPEITFTLSFPEPHTHYTEVEMRISNIKSKEIEVNMPVWTPGSYLIREFSKNVESLNAFTLEGNKLPVKKSAKNRWKITTNEHHSIVVKYNIYAFEISVRTSFIDANHAFISPTGIFMYVKESLNDSVAVTIIPYKNWSKISTGLEKSTIKNTYYADNFDQLYDSPIEIGNQDIFEFKASGVTHEVAMVGGGNYNKEQLIKDMIKIVEQSTSIFGENPNKRYVFIVHNYQNGGGGLEHLNSTVLGAKRMGYSDVNIYKNFLGLVAHEYFHLWNVKRLRPVALGPFDYDNENYTTDLWIAEGFTAFYDNLLIRRSGIVSMSDYLSLIENDINHQLNLPGDKIQSVTDASFDAWIKHYRPNENSTNTTVSYYTKGSLLAAILNLKIIHNSNGEKNLDNVMKSAYQRFYKELNRGFTSDEFKQLLEEMAGENLDSFYADYIQGTRSVDFNAYLSLAGLKLTENTHNKKADLGIVLNKENIVIKVIRNAAGWTSGINVNDEIIAINGYKINNIESQIAKIEIGREIDLLINRDEKLLTLKVKLLENPIKKFSIKRIDNPSEKQLMVYQKWLN